MQFNNQFGNGVRFVNTTLGSATAVSGLVGVNNTTIVATNLGSVDNNNKIFMSVGGVVSTGAGLTDTTVRTVGSFGERFEVDGGGVANFYIPIMVVKNQEVTVSAYLRKNATYDNQLLPKIELLGCGITKDYDQMTDVDNTWEQLSVTGTPSISGSALLAIEISNTASGGYVYIDDISVVGGVTDEMTTLDYWSFTSGSSGIPALKSSGGAGGGSFGCVY